ncbi:hypothetical protein [Paenibacillus sp. SN-8-1]|uniref:hypothetical protein n=1 Tax=Paenibacillus sp. SN-8-1 TaxID=3435409 RepID=UPI003D9A23F0
MTKKRIVLFSLLIGFLTFLIAFGILLVFHKNWMISLVITVLLAIVSCLSSYRTMASAFNLDMK